MSTQPGTHRPLIDPLQFEEAGRALRRLLDALRRPQLLRAETDTSIAWEDGEPAEDAPAERAIRR